MSSLSKNIELIKGIHPGVILERELKKRKLSKRRLAILIGEYPQLLGDITKGKRRINPSLSIRLGNTLGVDESFFLVLQTYFDIEQEKKKQALQNKPDLSKLRTVLFWDTDINLINWEKSKASIIKRIFERGNQQELTEIIRFYGKKEIEKVLIQLKGRSVSIAEKTNLILGELDV
jgi:plasmid maintenance system antidote protein VapI